MLARAKLDKQDAEGDEKEKEEKVAEVGEVPKGMDDGWSDADSDKFRAWMNTNRNTAAVAKRLNLERAEELKSKYGEDSDAYKNRATSKTIITAYTKMGGRNMPYGEEWLTKAKTQYDTKKAEIEAAAKEKEWLEKGYGPIDTEEQFRLMRANQANTKRSMAANKGKELKSPAAITDLTAHYRRGLSLVYVYHVNEFDGSGGADTDDHTPLAAKAIKKVFKAKNILLDAPGHRSDATATKALSYAGDKDVVAIAYDPATQDLYIRVVLSRSDTTWNKVIKGVPHERGFLWMAKGSQQEDVEGAERDAGQEAEAKKVDFKAEAERISQDIQTWWEDNGGTNPDSDGYYFTKYLSSYGDETKQAFNHYKRDNDVWPQDAIDKLPTEYKTVFKTLLSDIKEQMTDFTINDVSWTVPGGQSYDISDDALDI
jgi:hypothetical protein